MTNQLRFKASAWQLVLVLGLLVVVLASSRTATAVPQTPEENPAWSTPAPVSAAGQDVRRPRIAGSPDGSRLLVVYINESDDDPYYTLSSDQGQTWTPAGGAKLQTTQGTSAQIVGVVDQTNKAFAIWVEKNTALGNELVFASKTGNGSWTTPVSITDATEILDPFVMLDQNNTIHLVWVQQEVVHYAYLPGGAQTWSTPVIVEETPLGPSAEPSIAVDRNGRLYLVWQNDTVTPGGLEVVFSRGRVTGTPAAPDWVPEVANLVLSPASMPIAAHAVIAAAGNQIHIAYTRKIDIPAPDNDRQDIFYTSCFMPCNGLSSDDFTIVSGALVEVNGNDPSEVVAALAVDTQRLAAYIAFSGILPPIITTYPNEIIQGVQSCDNWVPYSINLSADERFIKPFMIVNQGWLHLVYDRISSDNSHQVFHRRAEVTCDANLYIPAIFRN